MKQLDLARSGYKNIEAIKNKGLSDLLDMIEFIEIIKSFEDYILPMTSEDVKMAQQAVETSSEQSKKQQSVTPEASRDAEIERVGLQDTLKNFRQSGEQGVWNTQAEASILDTVRRAEMTQTGVEALNASLSVHINNLNNMQNGMTMQEMSKLQDMADRTKALQTNILSEYEQSRAAIMEPSVVQNSGTKQTRVEGTVL